MSEKKKLKDKETEKVDGGFPILIGIPSAAKIKTKLPDQVEESTPDQQPGIKEQFHD